MRAKFRVVRAVTCLGWLLIVGAAFATILNFQTARGPARLGPEAWPPNTTLFLDPDRDTLVMFAHPKCPWTRASVEELSRLLSRCPGKISAQICFLQPAKFPDVWSQSELRRAAAAIPGVTVSDDLAGAQAQLFGVDTSGCVLLYNPAGRLLFKGGLVGPRGAADDTRAKAILAITAGNELKLVQTPAYGCSLVDHCASAEAFPNKF